MKLRGCSQVLLQGFTYGFKLPNREAAVGLTADIGEIVVWRARRGEGSRD